MDARRAVITEAETWIGTPYHHAAAVKGAGVDCARILIEVYSAARGIDKPDVGYYPPDWMLHRSEERYLGWIEKYCDRIAAPRMADIVLFKFGRCFSHAGIVVAWPNIIHAQRGEGVCYADATKGRLEGRETMFFALKDL